MKCDKWPRCGCPDQDECVEPVKQQMVARVFYFSESTGNEWWSVFLMHVDQQESPLQGHQIYRDEIKGRADYECDLVNSFIDGSPSPSLLNYDTDPPPKLAAKWKHQNERVMYQVRRKKGGTWGPGCNRSTAAGLYKTGDFEVRALLVDPNFYPSSLEAP